MEFDNLLNLLYAVGSNWIGSKVVILGLRTIGNRKYLHVTTGSRYKILTKTGWEKSFGNLPKLKGWLAIMIGIFILLLGIFFLYVALSFYKSTLPY